MKKYLLSILIFLLTADVLIFSRGGVEPGPDPEEDPASVMVETQIESRGVTSPRVLSAMRNVRRAEFVPREYRHLAYADRPLPIGYGQTISQPYIVAFMTELLDIDRGEKVLEIGTGSGYQAAVLAELTDRVYTIEIISELAIAAGEKFKELGYDRIQLKNQDGYYGWEGETFDGIIVTAAAGHVPPPLISQLNPGGRMVIPVGGRFEVQYLTLITMDENRELTVFPLLPVSFVPFTGDQMEPGK